MSLFNEPWPYLIAESRPDREPMAPLDAIQAFQFACSCDGCAVDKTMFWADTSKSLPEELDRQNRSLLQVRATVRPRRREWPISARMLVLMSDEQRVGFVQRYEVDFDCKATWAIVDDLVSRGLGENLVTRAEWQSHRSRLTTRKRKQ